MRSDRVLIPKHPLWMEFLSKLARAHACRGTTDHARSVLASMPGIDVEGTLQALAAMGGGCDCAIERDIAPLQGAAHERVEGAA